MATTIEWTDETWNPLRGCRRISPGCLHCYAERQAARPILSGPGQPYEGLVTFGKQGPRWTGRSAGPDKLDVPLHWKKPRRIFVCSMSDLFYEGHSDDAIAKVFAAMAASPKHTFQVLTKRPERAVQWFAGVHGYSAYQRTSFFSDFDLFPNTEDTPRICRFEAAGVPWPLPNVWIGTSAEDQERLDERWPYLLQVPASVLFLSLEPALGPMELPGSFLARGSSAWAVWGGESGPGARPCDIAWGEDIVAQCYPRGVPVFIKQTGAVTTMDEARWRRCSPTPMLSARSKGREGPGRVALAMAHSKGGDFDEISRRFPDLAVRAFPGAL